MSKLKLSIAIAPYDRSQALMDGTVVPEGIDPSILPMQVEEIFWRSLRNAEFDVSEASLSSYTVLRSKGDDRFIAIPVFTSRAFRHSGIFINVNKGIKRPEDLIGKSVGIPEYQLTGVVWQRGIVADEYGVYPKDMRWRNGGLESPGRVEKLSVKLPEGVHLEPIPADKTLSEMLDTGEIDALFSPRPPSCAINGSPNVSRLFPNYREVEEDYYRRTGIFPIMHVVIIRRELYEANRWIAMNLFKAFCESKDAALNRYHGASIFYISLPWVNEEVAATRALLGEDFYSYGIEKNYKALEAFFRYHHDQGLSDRLMGIEDIFAAETIGGQFVV